MPSYNADILPSTSGLNLGNSIQKWDATLRSATIDNLLSSSTNAATAGAIRLASTDIISWKTNDNTSEVHLGKTGPANDNVPADTLVFTGGGMEADAFISDSSHPAATGVLRLGVDDTITYRNQANTGDVNGMSHGTDDSITIGGTAGVKSAVFQGTGSVATAGSIRLPNSGSIKWLNAAGNANYGLAADTSDRIVNDATNGILLTGTAPNIRMGGTTSAFPMLKRNSTTVECRTADDSTYGQFGANSFVTPGINISQNIISKYNNINLAGIGMPINVAVLDSTNAAAITTTTLFATTTNAGLYRLSYYLYVSVAGNAVNLTGTFGWTDDVAVAKSVTTANISCNVLGASSTLIGQSSCLTMLAGATTNITYAFALSGAIGVGFYRAKLTLEYLG